MRSFFISIYTLIQEFGIDPLKFLYSLRSLPSFFRDFLLFRRLGRDPLSVDSLRPLHIHFRLGDHFAGAGDVANHYFQMDLYVAQRVFETGSEKHLDVGSRIDGFVAHVASFRPVEVLDIRPLPPIIIRNISFKQADLMDESVDWEEMAADSVSCLHALEHFGLGRYGDPIDPTAHERGFRNLTRLSSSGGVLHLAVPVSESPRIEFNAHRVFDFPYLRKLVESSFSIESVALVDDRGILSENLSPDDVDAERSWGCYYGCVILSLRKP